MFIKKFLEVPVQRAHFVDGVHSMVGGAELAQRSGTHQLEKAQAGLAVLFPFKVCILLGQNGVPGISDSVVSSMLASSTRFRYAVSPLSFFRSPSVL